MESSFDTALRLALDLHRSEIEGKNALEVWPRHCAVFSLAPETFAPTNAMASRIFPVQVYAQPVGRSSGRARRKIGRMKSWRVTSRGLDSREY